MTQDDQDKLMQAITADDPRALDAVLGARKNVCLGRFTLLALCYMYNCKRIVKAYRGPMQQGPRVMLPEPIAVYRDFVRLAGRALRFFAGTQANTVEAPYMLALLGHWRMLRRYAADNKMDDAQRQITIDLVRMRYGVVAYWQGNRLVLPPKPLAKDKRALVLACVVLTALLLTVSVALLVLGYPASRRLVLREGVFDVALQRDVAVVGHINRGDVRLDGQGHTLTVQVDDAPLMTSFYGRLCNCTVRLVCADITLRDSWAAWCIENHGTFDNVRFVLQGPEEGFAVTLADFVKQQIEDGTETNADCGFGLVCVTNYGTVQGCTVEGNWQWMGNGDVNAQLGVVAAYNHGTIDNVTLQTTVNCDTVDVGGVVFRNESDGTVSGCVYRADSLSQITSLFDWSPLVGGVAAFNYGLVADCEVHTPLSCTKYGVTLPTGTFAPSATVLGGVAGYNYGTIRHCVVTGDLLAGASSDDIYCEGTLATVGGIVGEHITQEEVALLEQNIAQCTVYGKGYYNYVGGLCGTCMARLTANCFGGTVSTSGQYGTLAGVVVSDDPQQLFADNRLVSLWLNDFFRSAVPVVGYYTTGAEGVGGQAAYQMPGATSHYISELKTQQEYWYEE